MFDEDAKPARPAFQIGQDLALLSIDDLHETVAALKAEIARLEATIAAKQGTRASADALFKL